jgi:MFS family permease
MLGWAFIQNWETLAGLRAVLGILEAGMYPSSVYLLSTWYVRYDMGKRYAFFYLIGCFSQAFSGIFAYGLSQMDGVAGLEGWRWIFLIEGILTILLGFSAYWLVVGFPDGPESWRFLSKKEMQFVIEKVNADRGDAYAEPFKLSRFLRPALDWKSWAFAMLTFNTITITSALSFFLPLILRDGMGFGTGESQILIAPPYVVAAAYMFFTGWLSDKTRLRGPIVVLNNIVALIGLPLVGYAGPVGARYFGVFLLAGGTNANVPLLLTYQANNIRGQWKRAFCSALLVGLGAVGGIAGSLVFRSQDAPEYHPGLFACFACCGFNLIIVAILSVKFYGDNKKQAEGKMIIQDEKTFRYTY